jgi:hypothetical protein
MWTFSLVGELEPFLLEEMNICTITIELLKNKVNSPTNKTELRQKIDFHKELNKQVHI